MNHLKIPNHDTTLIELKEIFADYHKNFSGKRCILSTNYKLISEINIQFADSDLPHLLGLAKLNSLTKYTKNKSAGKIISAIKAGSLTHNLIQRDKNYSDIVDRINFYDFLGQVFYNENYTPMVITKDVKPNPLHVDIIFYDFTDDSHRRVVILGLRSVSKTQGNYYVPATLHVRVIPDTYVMRRKTRVTSMTWK